MPCSANYLRLNLLEIVTDDDLKTDKMCFTTALL